MPVVPSILLVNLALADKITAAEIQKLGTIALVTEYSNVHVMVPAVFAEIPSNVPSMRLVQYAHAASTARVILRPVRAVS